jgi:ElaB/YqjD/DUF883 family membrane-anchored ribosome-binding protein
MRSLSTWAKLDHHREKIMAKKKPAKSSSESAATNDEQTEATIEVQSASEQVTTAREQLRAAEELLEQARDQAATHVAWLRDQTTGELIDSSLDFVRRHPGLSVLSAASVGFLFARLFRR